MERTRNGVHWRAVAAFAAAGALLMLMTWAFVHDHRWLMYLGLLGLLGVIHAFDDTWASAKDSLYRFFGSTTTRVRVHRSGHARRSRSIQIHQ